MGAIIFDNNKIDLKDNYIIEIEDLRSSIPFKINDFDNQQLKFCFINCNVQLNFKNKYKIVNGNDMHNLRKKFEKLEDSIFNFIIRMNLNYDYYFIESTGLSLSEIINLKLNIEKLVSLNIKVYFFIFKVNFLKFEIK